MIQSSINYAKLHNNKTKNWIKEKIKCVSYLNGVPKSEDGNVVVDFKNSSLVTLCPMRFWQDYTVFRSIGKTILQTETPALIKEIGFLQSVDRTGRVTGETVGRIDMVLAKLGEKESIEDWCAVEMQAVYFSGKGMMSEFKAVRAQPDRPLFPTAIRRPDYRSSGPKRLMPQLQIKVPSLRRWGKTMAVVVDESFFGSIAPMKRAPHISNADIAWFIVDYTGRDGGIEVRDIVLTTLESSVDGLTAGEPLSREAFETELKSYLAARKDKVVRI